MVVINNFDVTRQPVFVKYIFYLEYHFHLMTTATGTLIELEAEKKNNTKNIIRLFSTYTYDDTTRMYRGNVTSVDIRDIQTRDAYNDNDKRLIITFMLNRIIKYCENNPFYVDYAVRSLQGEATRTIFDTFIIVQNNNAFIVEGTIQEFINDHVIVDDNLDDVAQEFGEDISIRCHAGGGKPWFNVVLNTRKYNQSFVYITMQYINKMKLYLDGPNKVIPFDSFYIYLLRTLLFSFPRLPIKSENAVIQAFYDNCKNPENTTLFYCQMFIKFWDTVNH